MNILILSPGHSVSLIRAFRKELSLLYPLGKVYTAEMQPRLAAACIVSDGAFTMSEVTDAVYIPELLQLCRDHHIRMVIPVTDTGLQVLADHKEMFRAEGIHLIVSSPLVIRKCRDKRQTDLFFREHGLDVPQPVNKHLPTFPLFLKPYDGSRSEQTFLIRRPEELTPYHYSNEKLMFQEYIDPANHDEYSVDMYYGADSRVKCIVPRRRLEVRSGAISKGVTVKNSIVPRLKEWMGTIPGAAGCLTLQLFLHKYTDRMTGIEINPRFGSGFPLSYLAGANFPRCLIREYGKEETVAYSDEWEENLLMLRYDDEVLVHHYEASSAVC